ncbi:peroxide stress protein YaaA [Aureibaculum sp. 2210JD6-5]|uniref:peroxide stress protein YaaA n=1 Tax=Aureibaculum sp. 2210JD6-5 TaxID=3103957 RepID=UPI002AAD24D6|nr:peroxide stress protein YaaA [Aureibaculum sp. 2210JD6-5]MDY7393766.1 peroxide stress protein YaaA [Aureibaculum sp. 2210JD6-5]
MKIIISPAKSLDFESEVPTKKYTEPIFLEQAEKLSTVLKKKSAKQLSKLMNISDNLGQLNYDRNQQWSLPFTTKNSKQAIYAFTGDVFRGLDMATLPTKKLDQLQDKLRIISGQYGLLKPLDLMQPYRLEMGTKLKIGRKDNLYKFWDTSITEALNEELEDNEPVINLASTEYFKAIKPKVLKSPIITPVFKDLKNGKYKTIMTYAKLARGYMVRYIIDNDIDTVEGLKGFDTEGYAFDANMSSENELVFTR